VTVRLVVYGLLRRGASMSDLLHGAEYKGPVTVPGFDLYDLGPFPGAVPGTGELRGELFELASPAVLAVLDEAEGVHAKPPLFRRELVEAKDAPAWMYVFAAKPPENAHRIESGDWLLP